MTEETENRPRWLAVLLVLLPLWLILSGAAGIWWFLHREKQEEIRGQQRFARMVSEKSLADDLRKIVDYIGERHASSEAAATGLTRTAAMIEGLLGPSNTGYTVRRARGPENWPLVHVSLPGGNEKSPALWIVASYDSRPGTPGVEANATGLAATLAAAQAIAADQPARPVHIAFIPHANDAGSPVAETAAALRLLIVSSGAPQLVLCVEAMGGGEELLLSSPDNAAIPLQLIRGIATVRDTPSDAPADLTSRLVSQNLPAVRVATRPSPAADDPDDRLPAPAALAAASGRLIELIRRCAAAP
jgi:hypothetical protein